MPSEFPIAYWPVWDSDAEFFPGASAPPDDAALYAALTFVFFGDFFVLADIAGRGLCIPSGRVEPGETAAQAAVREIWEETGARVSEVRSIGGYRIVSRASGKARWCPVFVAEVVQFEPLPNPTESRGCFFARSADIPRVYFTWDPLIEAVFAYAASRR